MKAFWKKFWEYASMTPYASLGFRLGFVLLMGAIARIIFLCINNAYFSIEGSGIFSLLLGGLRFDISSMLWLNLPFILLCILPIPWRYTKPYRILSDVLYVGVNSFGWLLCLGDTAYFPFALKRSSFALLTSEGMNADIALTILRGSLDYPLLLFFAVLGIFFFIWICRKSCWKPPSGRNYLHSTVSLVLAVGLWVVGSRGGVQYKPLDILDAAYYAPGTGTAVVLNTSFVMMKTYNRKSVPTRNDFSKEEQAKIYVSKYKPINSGILPSNVKKSSKPINVVLLIVESLSEEYRQTDKYTPFINSLAKNSFSFKAYANGTRSIESLPAILCGIPGLMDRSFLESVYASNRIDALPLYLEKLGYKSYFFHGGTNGTMRFDRFADKIGFDSYYGRTEYDDEADFDTHWGIFDEPFLQYTKRTIDSIASPFFACVYTLSSHHPYTIPDKYKGRFPKGSIPILESIAYTDYSLSKFFEEAKKSEWFNNTLFVITADHTAEAYTPEFSGPIEKYRIPIIFYQPGVTDAVNVASGAGIAKGNKYKYYDKSPAAPVQAIDIMPSILHYIGYWNENNEKIRSFGSSAFDTSSYKFAVHYQAGQYTFLDKYGAYVLTNHPAMEQEKEDKRLRFGFAFLQEYMESLNKNDYFIKTYQEGDR